MIEPKAKNNKNMKLTNHSLTTLTVLALAAIVSPASAASYITTGQTVTGATTSPTLTAANITPNPNGVTLNNSSGNLVVNFKSDSPNGDFFFQWNGAGDGLGFLTTTYKYVQVDIASVSAGMVASNWQIFFEDNDSGIGGGNNSGQTILGGAVTPQATPFSLVIDLTDDGTNTSGAMGWGAGALDKFRFDPFNSGANKGESFTISAVTFGSALTEVVPEPSSSALLGLGGLALILRRRRA